jgi:hypothetical protein
MYAKHIDSGADIKVTAYTAQKIRNAIFNIMKIDVQIEMWYHADTTSYYRIVVTKKNSAIVSAFVLGYLASMNS